MVPNVVAEQLRCECAGRGFRADLNLSVPDRLERKQRLQHVSP